MQNGHLIRLGRIIGKQDCMKKRIFLKKESNMSLKNKKLTEIDQFVETEGIKSELKKNNDLFNELKRQYNSIQNSLDLIYNDRDLIKELKADVEAQRALILALDKHNENLTQDLKQEVIETGSKVEQTAEEVKDTV